MNMKCSNPNQSWDGWVDGCWWWEEDSGTLIIMSTWPWCRDCRAGTSAAAAAAQIRRHQKRKWTVLKERRKSLFQFLFLSSACSSFSYRHPFWFWQILTFTNRIRFYCYCCCCCEKKIFQEDSSRKLAPTTRHTDLMILAPVFVVDSALFWWHLHFTSLLFV